MCQSAKPHHAVHCVQTRAQATEGQQGRVFNNGAAVDFGVALDCRSARDKGGSSNMGVGTDISRRDHSRFAMDPRPLPQPDARLYFFALGFNAVAR